MTAPVITIDRPDAHVVVITMDRPPVNALDGAAQRDLHDAFVAAGEDLDVRAVVLQSAGRHFCAGADLREEQSMERDEVGSFLVGFGSLLHVVRHHRVPVVAAIGGAAHGGGLELALACDVRIGGPRAAFGAAGVNVGLIASFWSLTHLVGEARARMMLLTGWPLDADGAREAGLLAEVVDEAHLSARALEVAERIASRSPLAVEAAKRCLNQAAGLSEREAQELQVTEFSELFRTEDHAEALVAHFEKRPGVYHRR